MALDGVVGLSLPIIVLFVTGIFGNNAIPVRAAATFVGWRGYHHCSSRCRRQSAAPFIIGPTTTIMSSTFAEYVQSVSSSVDLTTTTTSSSSNHYVLGNPAGDADSIVSALAYSYVQSLLLPKADSSSSSPTTSSSSSTTTTTMVPIVSIPKNDLSLRRETVILLDMVGIQPHHLLHVDDDRFSLVPTNSDATCTTTTTTTTAEPLTTTTLLQDAPFTLVDHNRLALHAEASIQPSFCNIVEIIDHHLDEGYHADCPNREIDFSSEGQQATVASTCTLVAEKLLSMDDEKNIPQDVALALLGVILLDSVNMSPMAGKGTARDQEAIHQLQQRVDWKCNTNQPPTSGGFRLSDILCVPTTTTTADDAASDDSPPKETMIDTDRLYQILSQSKTDPLFWKGLSARDALRLDYKQFESHGRVFGASSVLVTPADFLSKPQWQDQVVTYMDACQIPLLLVLCTVLRLEPPVNDDDKASTTTDAPSLERSILVMGKRNSNNDNDEEVRSEQELMVEEITHHLLQSELLQCELVPIAHAGNVQQVHVRQLQQNNPKASRKQVVPVLLDYYNNNNNNNKAQ